MMTPYTQVTFHVQIMQWIHCKYESEKVSDKVDMACLFNVND